MCKSPEDFAEKEDWFLKCRIGLRRSRYSIRWRRLERFIALVSDDMLILLLFVSSNKFAWKVKKEIFRRQKEGFLLTRWFRKGNENGQ